MPENFKLIHTKNSIGKCAQAFIVAGELVIKFEKGADICSVIQKACVEIIQNGQIIIDKGIAVLLKNSNIRNNDKINEGKKFSSISIPLDSPIDEPCTISIYTLTPFLEKRTFFK